MVGSGRGDGCGAFLSLFRLTMVPEWMQAAVLGGVFLTSMHTNLILSGWDRQLQTLGLIHALQSISLSRPTLLSCLPLIRD